MARAGPRTALAPLVLVLAALPAAPRPEAQESGERLSLEELLRAARERHAENLEQLRPAVLELVQRLEGLGANPPPPAVAEAVEGLAALGPEAPPLLVPQLETPEDAPRGAVRRASAVADALARMDTRAATDALARLAREGSPAARARAVRVLGASPDAERASAVLAEVFRAETPKEVRAAAAEGLGRLGGPLAEEVLAEALGSSEPTVLSAVLAALEASGAGTARERVLALASEPPRAARVVPELLAYYRARAALAGLAADEIAALAALAASAEPPPAHRRALVAALPELGARLDSALQRTLRPLLDQPEESLRTEALVALARLGDRNARRDVLAPFDELVARNPEWHGGYEQRGALKLRIGEPVEAARDLEKAIELLESRRRPVPRATRVELARAWALAGKLRSAHDALAAARLPSDQRAELAEDPDFRALREHSRYGRVFE